MSAITTDDLHRIFKNLDKNNHGRVKVHELHHLLENIGIHTTLEDLEKLVGDTSLCYMDFLFFYETIVKTRIVESKGCSSDDRDQLDHGHDDLLKAFKVFDLNGDGLISSEELQSVLARLGLWDNQRGQEDCKEMIHVYDQNLDGALDFEEFKVMMSSPPTSDSEI